MNLCAKLKLKQSVIASGLWVCCLPFAHAANFADCSEHFYQALAPEHIEPKLNIDSAELCFNGFATFYSGLTRTPLWAAEHLTRERLYQAEQIPRDDSFHSESRLPSRMQAELADYKGSGFDRGHLAPNADMATLAQQYDSFSLANIIPQSPDNNRYIWRNLESVVRYLTKQHGEVYVLTGAVFIGDEVVVLNERVIVPTHVFKAVYIPSTGEAGAYYAPNDDTERVEVISLDELALRSGVDAFPALAGEQTATVPNFAFRVSDIVDNSSNDSDPAQESIWIAIIIVIIEWLANWLRS